MDPALALVQGYLHVNGYFTVTEYPVIEAMGKGAYRAAAELDVLAVRFPGAGRLVPTARSRAKAEEEVYEADSELDTPEDQVDMLIAEVKQGHAELNRGARNRSVIRAVIGRFGACPPRHADRVIDEVLRRGEATTPLGHRVRVVAFGTHAGENPGRAYKVITLGHILEFTEAYLREHWEVLHHASFTHPGLGLLMVLEKARRAFGTA